MLDCYYSSKILVYVLVKINYQVLLQVKYPLTGVLVVRTVKFNYKIRYLLQWWMQPKKGIDIYHTVTAFAAVHTETPNGHGAGTDTGAMQRQIPEPFLC